MRFLLDTNVVSRLVRDPHGHLVDRVREVGDTEVCTSIIVAAELRYGVSITDACVSWETTERMLRWGYGELSKAGKAVAIVTA